MGFRLSNFLPGSSKKKTTLPPNRSPDEWFIEWTRRRTVQTGGQNYSLSSHQLPLFSLSGPLPTNAKRFNALEPAPAIDSRRYPTVTVTRSNSVNGQVFSQPLVDTDTGEFTSSLMPINARPYNLNGIRPGGVA